MLVERTAGHGASSIVDVLDRVLDKGLSIAGDIRIAVAEVELLTIRIRLIVCSIDKAEENGCPSVGGADRAPFGGSDDLA